MLEAVQTQIESGKGVRKKESKSLLWFIRLLSFALVGVNWACHACTLPGLLSLWLGNRASPWGPKFGISIQYGNGPPFAACHHKIGGFVLARVPPAEWGPVFLLCSMTPLTLSVDFLSLFLGCALSALLISSAFLSSSRTALGKKKRSADYRSHIPSEKVHLVIFFYH